MPTRLAHKNQRTGKVTETDYYTVSERIQALHEERRTDPAKPTVDIETVIVQDDDGFVTVRATVRTAYGTYTGHARSDKASRSIEGDSPVETAETSAVGRALAFAGLLVSVGVASADELRRAQNAPPRPAPAPSNGATAAPVTREQAQRRASARQEPLGGDPAAPPPTETGAAETVARRGFYAVAKSRGLDDAQAIHDALRLPCFDRQHADPSAPNPCHALREAVDEYAERKSVGKEVAWTVFRDKVAELPELIALAVEAVPGGAE